MWKELKKVMAEDYARSYDSLQSEEMAYDHIQELFQEQSYHDFHVSEMDAMKSIVYNTTSIPTKQYFQKGLDQYSRMNVTQKQLTDVILAALGDINDKNGKCFFIDVPGGSGKTYMYDTLYYLVKGRNKEVSTIVLTRIAATLLPEEKTVHKTLRLPVPLFSDSSSSIKSQTEAGQKLKNVDIFI